MRYQDTKQFKNLCGYTIAGVWYPRVTKILEIKSKPGLEQFFREVGDYASAEAIKNKSAEEGSLLHSTIEQYVRGELTTIPEGLQASVVAFEEFQKKRHILFYPDLIEKQVWSLRYRYAGTVDALVSIGGRFGVLDIKTSSGFYPEYNLQTAAYVFALRELEVKRALALPQEVETRWILRIDQCRRCNACGATVREKGGRQKIRAGGISRGCAEGHRWGDVKGVVELKELPYNIYKDIRAFVAAKILWEWEHDYWLRQSGYLKVC